ncbi:hypothetical protein HS961_20750 [Comamonas piscis]|uniref:AbiTii domain-containing protein n=1 Tax=Comamonas piscis TaxID=1562974 RepID=A0A7G5EM51_9BURK|nr:hypothetical protein [Comamonas piscis]QMV75076.1 hypothetical protein HS961_20750 [Comamonas piscis]WSO33560.1 hypothetical protein VUJ63_20815 [Comamonas piscis]
MPALVPELVNMASDPNVSTTDLLRRSLVVAHRLAVPELVDWITFELDGFRGNPIPPYREIIGRPQVLNPLQGYQPLMFPDVKWTTLFSKIKIKQSLPELEQLAKSETGVRVNYSAELEHKLRESLAIPLTPSVAISTVQIYGIVEQVRSRILKWALDLEVRGIIGEGMSFTPQEKQAVQQQHYHFGDVSGSQIQISSSGSTQTQANTQCTDIDALKGLMQALGAVLVNAKGDTADELRAELATLKAQAESPKPKWEIIKATARSIKTVAEGAGGSILAGLAQPHMANLLALAG